jgi:hypothetical protein
MRMTILLLILFSSFTSTFTITRARKHKNTELPAKYDSQLGLFTAYIHVENRKEYTLYEQMSPRFPLKSVSCRNALGATCCKADNV